jgi:23S rRNA pseudouridine1911/1915/1917 synthase
MQEENKSTFYVTDDFAGERLDVYVTKICEFIPSRSFAGKLIDAGKVLVNGKIRKSSFKLLSDHAVELDLSFLSEINVSPAAESIPLSILFEDDDLIVIDKPAGMVVHPGAGVSSGTLVNAIMGHCGVTLPSLGNPSRAGIVHRLDRDTSGVMVVAKSQRALTKLSMQFARHEQLRKYHTIVYGSFLGAQRQDQKIETWHGRDPRNRIKYSVQQDGIGKKAILFYQILENLCQDMASLVECRLETGRTHQIRVQMASIGHGVVGDSLYTVVPQSVRNNKELFAQIHKLVSRQMLHALELGFKHPATDEMMTFRSDYPEDFKQTLQWLRDRNG